MCGEVEEGRNDFVLERWFEETKVEYKMKNGEMSASKVNWKGREKKID